MAHITKLELELKALRKEVGKLKRKMTLHDKKMAKTRELISDYKKLLNK